MAGNREPRADRTPPAVREAVLAAIQAGCTTREVAAAYKLSNATVSVIVQEAGRTGDVGAADLSRITLERSQHRREWAREDRAALLNKLFERLDESIASARKPLDLKAWATAYAIAVDKRRLEDGDATSIQQVQTTGVRERIAAKLDDLAARREARQAHTPRKDDVS